MSAFLFVPLYVATGLLCFLLLCFAAHYFLVVLQSAAAGAEETVWPGDSFIEFFGKVFYLTIMAGIWLVPATILGSALASTGIPKLVVGITVFWIGFPISMLSSLSSESSWVPFTPSLFYRFGQRMGALFQFYLLSLPLVLGAGWSVGRIFQKAGPDGFGWAILASLVLAAAWLIYARLLGRFGLILLFTKDPHKIRRRLPTRPVSEPAPEPVARAVEVSDPWAMPESPPIPEEPLGEDEIFIDEDAFVEDEDLAAYEVSGEEAPPTPPVDPTPNYRRRARHPRRRRLDVLREPASLFETNALMFLAEVKCVSAFVQLAIGCLAVSGMVTALMALWPE